MELKERKEEGFIWLTSSRPVRTESFRNEPLLGMEGGEVLFMQLESSLLCWQGPSLDIGLSSLNVRFNVVDTWCLLVFEGRKLTRADLVLTCIQLWGTAMRNNCLTEHSCCCNQSPGDESNLNRFNLKNRVVVFRAGRNDTREGVVTSCWVELNWCYDRRSVSISVFLSGTPLGPMTRYFFFLSFAG
jgi:hypothetical protein